jgi:glycerol-3-phosphate O-acyltransferase
VVFVMNHRSNMDYIVASYLAAERAALSYAVGEWAQVIGLQQLIRAMGAYFVRRNSKDELYRRVLERYIAMATEAGVTQAVYPEGGLTKDGAMREPRFGVIDYMLRGYHHGGERDLVFVPLGLNYDRVLEDRTQLRSGDAATPRVGGLQAARRTHWDLWARNWACCCAAAGTALAMPASTSARRSRCANGRPRTASCWRNCPRNNARPKWLHWAGT